MMGVEPRCVLNPPNLASLEMFYDGERRNEQYCASVLRHLKQCRPIEILSDILLGNSSCCGLS